MDNSRSKRDSRRRQAISELINRLLDVLPNAPKGKSICHESILTAAYQWLVTMNHNSENETPARIAPNLQSTRSIGQIDIPSTIDPNQPPTPSTSVTNNYMIVVPSTALNEKKSARPPRLAVRPGPSVDVGVQTTPHTLVDKSTSMRAVLSHGGTQTESSTTRHKRPAPVMHENVMYQTYQYPPAPRTSKQRQTDTSSSHKTFSVDYLQQQHQHDRQYQQHQQPSDKWEHWNTANYQQPNQQTFHIETMFPETRQSSQNTQHQYAAPSQSTPHPYAAGGYYTYYDEGNAYCYPPPAKGFMPNFGFHQSREQ